MTSKRPAVQGNVPLFSGSTRGKLCTRKGGEFVVHNMNADGLKEVVNPDPTSRDRFCQTSARSGVHIMNSVFQKNTGGGSRHNQHLEFGENEKDNVLANSSWPTPIDKQERGAHHVTS